MYLEPSIRRKRKRRSSPVRVLLLLILICIGIYVYVNIRQERIESPFVPTPTPTRSASSYITEAEALYLRGQFTQTIAAYRQAIALEPNDVQSYIPLSRLLVLEGHVLEGIKEAQHATRLAPESAEAWAALGMAYDWNGNVTEAIEACKKAIELDPTYAEGYAYLAEAYADARRWAEAIEAAQTALQLDTRSADVYRNYGYVLERQADYWGALEAYEQALDIHPNLVHVHLAVGRCYRKLDNVDEALKSFQQAVEINPGDAQAQFELGWTYLVVVGDYDQAQVHLERATEADPQFGRAFGGLAITYWSRRHYEGAIPNFERALKLESAAARRRAKSFYITVEDRNDDDPGPSINVVMRGEFAPVSMDDLRTLQASLRPEGVEAGDEAWDNARGTVVFNTWEGEYTVELKDLPMPSPGQVYVGWFEGVSTLSGDPLGTGPLHVNVDGSVNAELEATWVSGPPIEYFYTLGLAYFYMAECEKSYPLFNAALQIDPEEPNALEGIRLCQNAESE